MSENRLCIELSDGFRLCVEKSLDPDFPELYIFLENNDGMCIQDLVVVGEKYDLDRITYDRIVPIHGEYDIKVYADENIEDYTNSFRVRRYTYD